MLAGFGEREFSSASLKESHAQIALEEGDIAADRRGSQPELSSGRREPAAFRAPHERFEI